MNRHRRGLLLFFLLSFSITWAVAFGVGARADLGSLRWNLLMTVLLAVPALSALYVREFVEDRGLRGAGLGRLGRGRYLLLGWLLPPLFAAITMGLSLLLRQAEFDPWMAELLMRMKLASPGASLDPNAARLGLIVFSFTVGMIPLLLAGLVSEFAWRGYLLPRLLPRLGAGRALVVTGAVAGVWYAPFVLLPHRLTPYLYPTHPLLGVLLMVGFSTLSGVFLGWLRLRSGSLWPAAVGAAALNGPARTALHFLSGRNDLTTGLTGLIGQAVLLVFVLGLGRAGALRVSAKEQGDEDAREALPKQSK